MMKNITKNITSIDLSDNLDDPKNNGKYKSLTPIHDINKSLSKKYEAEKILHKREDKWYINTVLVNLLIVAVGSVMAALPGMNLMVLTIALIGASLLPTFVSIWGTGRIRQEMDVNHTEINSLLNQKKEAEDKMLEQGKENIDEKERLDEYKKLLDKRYSRLTEKEEKLDSLKLELTSQALDLSKREKALEVQYSPKSEKNTQTDINIATEKQSTLRPNSEVKSFADRVNSKRIYSDIEREANDYEEKLFAEKVRKINPAHNHDLIFG